MPDDIVSRWRTVIARRLTESGWLIGKKSATRLSSRRRPSSMAMPTAAATKVLEQEYIVCMLSALKGAG